MLKSLTHKLKNQTLREGLQHSKKNWEEDRDSGTESDDEHAEEEDIEINMDSETYRTDSKVAVSTPPKRVCGRMAECEYDSALPSDSDLTTDQHSSEEELEVINGSSPCREKRKWSQMTRSSGGASRGDSSCSSDDELHGLLSATPTPLQFRSSPPADAHRPGSQSPPAKLFHPSSAATNTSTTTLSTTSTSQQGSSPRKRHRHGGRPHHIQRPCLDFEKMQQLKTRAVTTWRHGGGEQQQLSLYCW